MNTEQNRKPNLVKYKKTVRNRIIYLIIEFLGASLLFISILIVVSMVGRTDLELRNTYNEIAGIGYYIGRTIISLLIGGVGYITVRISSVELDKAERYIRKFEKFWMR